MTFIRNSGILPFPTTAERMKLTSLSPKDPWTEISLSRDDSTVDLIILFSGGTPAAFVIISQAVAHIDDQRFSQNSTVRKHILRWGGKRSRMKHGTEKFQVLLAQTIMERMTFLKGPQSNATLVPEA